MLTNIWVVVFQWTVLETPNEDLARELAMHITVFNPQFLSRKDVNEATIEIETKVLKEQIATDETLQPEKPQLVFYKDA